MAVPSVFVSSVRRGFEAERRAARDAITSLRMHAAMAETTAASPSSPRRALLDEVAAADVFLLIIGTRYGEAGPEGTSPTEDEFDEAKRLGKPTIVLVQEGTLEPSQAAFLERIRSGGWQAGILYAHFADAGTLAAAVVSALAKLNDAGAGGEDLETANARVADLLGAHLGAGFTSGVTARLAYAPTSQTVLLDALALEDPALPEDLASLARACGLVPQSVGLSAEASAAGVTIAGTAPWEQVDLRVHLAIDGAVSAQSSVRGEGGVFTGAIVNPDRLQALCQAAGRFTADALDRTDRRQEVRRVAVQLAIYDAEFKGFGAAPQNSMSLGGRVPAVVRVPERSEIVNRGELATPETTRRLVAAVRRVFADAGRVYE